MLWILPTQHPLAGPISRPIVVLIRSESSIYYMGVPSSSRVYPECQVLRIEIGVSVPALLPRVQQIIPKPIPIHSSHVGALSDFQNCSPMSFIFRLKVTRRRYPKLRETSCYYGGSL